MSGGRFPLMGTGQAPQVQATRAATSNQLKTLAIPSLVSICDVPTTVTPPFQPYPQDTVAIQEGPYCPGLTPHIPMLTPFKLVVSYRHYRLHDIRAKLQDMESTQLYKIKRRFDSLYPTFQAFDGTKPINFLEVLATVKEGFNTLHASKALAVLALAYYLEGQAKTHYTALTTPGVRTTTSALGGTWPHIVDSFIKRYLTDDVLQAAYDKITDAKQKQAEEKKDNSVATLVACQTAPTKHRKYIDLCFHFLQDLVKSSRVAVQRTPSSSMRADILTKPLKKHYFPKLRTALYIIPSSAKDYHRRAGECQTT